MNSDGNVRIGIISDTHGLLRPEAVDVLDGVNLIIHAGDIDTLNVLEALGELADVKAVRGNMDRGEWAQQIPTVDLIEIGGIRIFALHDLQQLDLDPGTANIDVVVNGHTHRPIIYEKNDVLYINPGSAGYRRNSAPLGVGVLTIENGKMYTSLIDFDV